MVTEQAARTITGFRPAHLDRSTLAKRALKGPRFEFQHISSGSRSHARIRTTKVGDTHPGADRQ
jgi:hypothetical protein